MNLNGFEQNIPSTVFFYTISYWCCSSGTKVSSNITLRDFHLKQRLPHINTRQISNLILLPLFRGIERDVRSDDCAVLFFRVLKLSGPTLSYSILSLYFSSMCPVKYRGGTQIWNLLQMQAQRNWVVDSGCLHDHSRRKLRTRRASLHDGTKWQRLNCSCCLFQQGIDFLKHSKLNGHCTYQSVLSPVPPQPPLLQTWHLMS